MLVELNSAPVVTPAWPTTRAPCRPRMSNWKRLTASRTPLQPSQSQYPTFATFWPANREPGGSTSSPPIQYDVVALPDKSFAQPAAGAFQSGSMDTGYTVSGSDSSR